MRVVLALFVLAVSVLGQTIPKSSLLNTHKKLELETLALTKRITSLSADIESHKKLWAPLESEVEGNWKPEKAEAAKKSLATYYDLKRKHWITDRNKDAAIKMINRLQLRVPEVRAQIKPFFESYHQAERYLNELVEVKENLWHARRMAQLTARYAGELRAEADALAKDPKNAVVANSKRAAAADEEFKNKRFNENSKELAAQALVLRQKVVDECLRTARFRCNTLLRDYLVGSNRLWTALRNKQLAKEEMEAIDGPMEAARVGAIEDTFKDRTAGVTAFRALRGAWVEVWKLERERSLDRQTITRKHNRMDRIWAEVSRDTIDKQATAAADANGPLAPRDVAEVIGSQPVTYQTTVGKQKPAAQRRPITQFSGPNPDPKTLIEDEQRIH